MDCSGEELTAALKNGGHADLEVCPPGTPWPEGVPRTCPRCSRPVTLTRIKLGEASGGDCMACGIGW
jgi:hypothetical protein